MSDLILDFTIVEQHSVNMVRGNETFWKSQKKVGTIWGKLYYAEEDVPVGGKVPDWQNKPWCITWMTVCKCSRC